MKKLRTVIFGGSFDPIHIGHTSLAVEVLRLNLADEVWFLVSPLNPLKRGCRISDEKVRFSMVQLATEDNPRFVACDFEFALPRPSYTLHTLQALEGSFPDREFALLIGSDNWEKFDSWYRSDEILARYRIIVYPRGCSEPQSLPSGVTWLESPLLDVSSTAVRDAIARGNDVSEYLNPKVAAYIKKNKLYI